METSQERCFKSLFPFFPGEQKTEEEEQGKHIKQYLYHIAVITRYKLALQCFFLCLLQMWVRESMVLLNLSFSEAEHQLVRTVLTCDL